jgi:hypothetical protein
METMMLGVVGCSVKDTGKGGWSGFGEGFVVFSLYKERGGWKTHEEDSIHATT